MDESLAELKKGGQLLVSGVVTFGIFLAIAIIAYAVGGIWSAAFDLLLGLAFSSPQIIRGVARLNRADRMLDPGQELKSLPASHAQHPAGQQPAARTTESMEPPRQMPGSVTEATTFHLDTPESKS